MKPGLVPGFSWFAKGCYVSEMDVERRFVYAAVVAAGQLRRGSRILEHMIESDGQRVVVADYSLETGLADFFDGMPE
jgi:hypothetical protein